MRIGINATGLSLLGVGLDGYLAHAASAEEDGFASWWLGQLATPDVLTVLAIVGRSTSTIELGTAVVATWPRHPLMLATQALTVQEAAGGRLALGIGLAHKPTVEERLRIPFVRPARHMDEYLSVLLPAMTDRSVAFEGEIWSGFAEALGGHPGVAAPQVLLAAMGPKMLAITGSRAGGTVLWLSGPRTIEEHIRPSIQAAADASGRPTPRIVASVPVCVTNSPDDVRNAIAGILAGYNELPSYRAMMDREGVDGPAGVSIVGSEEVVRAELQRFADAGTTDFAAVEFGTNDDENSRTRALLKELAAA